MLHREKNFELSLFNPAGASRPQAGNRLTEALQLTLFYRQQDIFRSRVALDQLELHSEQFREKHRGVAQRRAGASATHEQFVVEEIPCRLYSRSLDSGTAAIGLFRAANPVELGRVETY